MSDRDRNWRREREAQHRKRKEKRAQRISNRPRMDDDNHDRRWERFDLPHEDHDLDD
jgi:hypothetical protein